MAIKWVKYLETHARRIYAAAVDPNLASAKALLKRIKKGMLKSEFSVRTVQRKGWSHLSTNAAVRGAIRMLVDYEYVREEGMSSERGPSKTVYHVNPRLFEEKR